MGSSIRINVISIFVATFASMAIVTYSAEAKNLLSDYQDAAEVMASQMAEAASAYQPRQTGAVATSTDNSNLDSDDDDDEDDLEGAIQQLQNPVSADTKLLYNSAAAAAQELAQQYQQPKTSSSDLKPAATHHHHGHGVKGWLEMGAWTGKKGAFGWHDKHPVGGKGRR